MFIPIENLFLVARIGENVVILAADPMRLRPLPRDYALNLAAWLVALADDDAEFPALLERVRGT